MQDKEFCIVYATVPDREVANAIAEAVVSKKLAACANMLSGMESVYWWRGNMERAAEVVVIFKTRRSLAEHVQQEIAAIHPYECPAAIVLPIDGGLPAFLQWIQDETDTAQV